MGINSPSSSTLAQSMRARLESVILQTVPLLPKAFMRVWSVTAAMYYKGLYLFGIDRAKQCHTRTQTGQDLIEEGAEWGVEYKYAQAWSGVLYLTASGGATIGVDNSFVADANGVKYTVDAPATESGGSIQVSVTAESVGVLGNLSVGDTLTITKEVAGANRLAEVQSITTTGTDDEDEEVFRERVLFEKRTAGGGGNAADYKTWAEETVGVARAYPYAGNPLLIPSGIPGERIVFCEAETSVDPDGVPTALILADARAHISYDPETGEARPPLGMTDSTLYVEPIYRTAFNVNIFGHTVESSQETAFKAQMSSDLNAHFRSVRPFLDGIDAPFDRRDTLTAVSIAEVVSGVARKYGASVQSINFDAGAGTLVEYLLSPGELAKLGILLYV